MGWLRNRVRRALGIGQYGTPTRTLKGERVKSISEARVADYLFRHDIAYLYEPRLWTGHLELKVIHPDFYLPDHDTFIEFWGLSGIQSYDRAKKYKREIYRRRRKQLVELRPGDLSDLDWKLGRFKQQPRVSRAPPRGRNFCSKCGMRTGATDRFCGQCGNQL
jgi:hypothetical protein